MYARLDDKAKEISQEIEDKKSMLKGSTKYTQNSKMKGKKGGQAKILCQVIKKFQNTGNKEPMSKCSKVCTGWEIRPRTKVQKNGICVLITPPLKIINTITNALMASMGN